MEVCGGGLIRCGRPRKYKNPRPVVLYLDSEILEEFDKQKGSLSRSEYLAILLKKHGESGIVLRENEELRRRIRKLETINAKLKKKFQKYEEIIRLSKERNKTEGKKKNLEIAEQIRNEVTKLIELKKRLNEDWNKHRIDEVSREIKKISNKCNHLLEKIQVDKTEFWRLVNSGNVEKAIKLLTS